MEESNSEYSSQELKLSRFMKVLAHPARIAIMIKLAEKNLCLQREIVKGLPITDSVVSRHLLALEMAGLIKGKTAIYNSYYCINWDVFWEFSDQFHAIFNNFQKNAELLKCDRYQ